MTDDATGISPQVGDLWYVRRAGAYTLVLIEVIDVTERTVEVRERGRLGNIARPERYEDGWLTFVERVDYD